MGLRAKKMSGKAKNGDEYFGMQPSPPPQKKNKIIPETATADGLSAGFTKHSIFNPGESAGRMDTNGQDSNPRNLEESPDALANSFND